MSSNDPKDKKDSNKSDFFRIDSEGEISPAFPDSEGSLSRLEPFFPTEEEASKTSESPASKPLKNEWPATVFEAEPQPDNTATKAPARSNNLEVQMDLIKPQVDSISRLSSVDSDSTNQVEVLRKYISLKEAEAKDLKEQLKQHQAILNKMTAEMNRASSAIQERGGQLDSLKAERERYKRELQELKDRYAGDVAQVRAELEERLRNTGKLDSDVEALLKQKEEWKEKIREDLKKIKLKERELETKHELLKRDMQALLDSKDKHLLELRKKTDALELEQETLEDRLRRSTFVLSSIDSKKKRLIETMRLAISLLEKIDSTDEYTNSDENQRKAG